MLLRILGSGTIKTAHQKNCSGYLINDEFLLDCGPGIWRALGLSRIKNEQIKTIALSHFHADHTSDLVPVLLERYLLPVSKRFELHLLGPIGLEKWFKDLIKIFGDWIKSVPIKIVELKSEYCLGYYNINVLPTGHTKNSMCFRIEETANKVLFYSGDSGENESVKKLAHNADLAIFEASNLPSTKIEGHLTPQLAARIAKKADVQKLILTHFYPEVHESDIMTEVKKYFDKEIIVAEDNMIIKI